MELPQDLQHEILMYLSSHDLQQLQIFVKQIWSRLLFRDFGLVDREDPYGKYMFEDMYTDGERYKERIEYIFENREKMGEEVFLDHRLLFVKIMGVFNLVRIFPDIVRESDVAEMFQSMQSPGYRYDGIKSISFSRNQDETYKLTIKMEEFEKKCNRRN